MKKLLCLLCALLLAVMSAALAEEETSVSENWYELSAEDTVLTVRLPSNELSGLAWEYEISAPESMELITEETIVGEDQGVGGTPTTFIASFRAIGEKDDQVSLIFRLTAEGEELPGMTYVLETSQDGEGRITLRSVYEQMHFGDWCEMSEDGKILTLRLPANATTGYEWSFTVLDPVIDCLTSEYVADEAAEGMVGVGGTFVASFNAREGQTGTTEIDLTYGRGDEDIAESRSVTVTAKEDGTLSVDLVSTLTVFDAPETAE